MDKPLVPRGHFSNSITDNVLIALRKIIQSVDIHSKHLMKKVGLTGPQLVILQEISKYDEAPVGTIARAISLSQATVTGILERLEKRALVTRRRDDIDRRRVLVRITDNGLQVLETAPPLLQESFVEQFSNLQDWEQSMILSSLERLVSIMEAKAIKAAPILATEPLGDTLKSPPSE